MLPDLLIEAIKGAVVGGVIGYFTNDIAVRMLFHPKRPWKLFGRTVPMTPGIVVKNKTRIADAIGDAVARDLLDPQTLLAHLREVNLREPIAVLLRQERAVLLATEQSIGDRLGKENRGPLDDLRARLSEYMAAKLAALAERPKPGEEFLRSAVHMMVDDVLEQPISHYVLPERLLRFRDFILAQLRLLLDREEANLFVLEHLHKALADFPESEAFATLEKVAHEHLGQHIPALADSFQEALAGFVTTEDFANAAQPRLARLLHQMIVNRFSMAKMFVSERFILEAVQTRWDGIIKELQSLARTPELQAFLIDQMDSAAIKLLRATRHAFTDEANRSRMASWLARELKDTLLDLLESSKTAEAIDRLLAEAAAKPARQLVPRIDEFIDRITHRTSEHLAAWVRTEEGRTWIRDRTADAIDYFLFRIPIGRIVAPIPEAEWGQISAYLSGVAEDRVFQTLPVILSTHVDLRRIVTQKIEDFDSDQVEEIIFRVSGSELKGIVWLGGALGLIVGAITQVGWYLLET